MTETCVLTSWYFISSSHRAISLVWEHLESQECLDHQEQKEIQ